MTFLLSTKTRPMIFAALVAFLSLSINTFVSAYSARSAYFEDDVRHLEEELSVDDLLKLRDDVIVSGMPGSFELLNGIHEIQQRQQTWDDNDENCGFNAPCGPELTCMSLGLQKKCVPLECFGQIAEEYRNHTVTDALLQEMFAKAGVTKEEIADAFFASDVYRQEPLLLMGYDNAFRRFTRVFQESGPDFGPILERTRTCMAKDPSVQGLTSLIGYSFGFGGVVRFDFAWLWGAGTSDIGSDVLNFPSAFFEFTLSGFAGVNLQTVAQFAWTYTGTKEDIPGSSLMWGGRLALGPGVAVEGSCDFPGAVPGITLEAGLGVGGGVDLGWTYSTMISNGTTNISLTAAPNAPTGCEPEPSRSPSATPTKKPTPVPSQAPSKSLKPSVSLKPSTLLKPTPAPTQAPTPAPTAAPLIPPIPGICSPAFERFQNLTSAVEHYVGDRVQGFIDGVGAWVGK